MSNRTSEWVDEAGNRASEWRDRAGNATQSVRDRVQSQTGGQRQDFSGYQGNQSSYRDRARDYGDQASRRARQGYSSVVGLVDEHPLLAGIMGVAVGAVLGASIPSSRYENELLGDYSDELYNRAREYGSEAIDRAATVARTAAEAGVEAAAMPARAKPRSRASLRSRSRTAPRRRPTTGKTVKALPYSRRALPAMQGRQRLFVSAVSRDRPASTEPSDADAVPCPFASSTAALAPAAMRWKSEPPVTNW